MLLASLAKFEKQEQNNLLVVKESLDLCNKSAAVKSNLPAQKVQLTPEVAKSALGNLESRFSDNPDQVAAINQYKDRADDLAYVLNSPSVKGNAQIEANFLNNLDKLDDLLDLITCELSHSPPLLPRSHSILFESSNNLDSILSFAFSC